MYKYKCCTVWFKMRSQLNMPFSKERIKLYPTLCLYLNFVSSSGSSDHPMDDGGAGNYWLRHAGGHWLCHSSQPPLCGQVPSSLLALKTFLKGIFLIVINDQKIHFPVILLQDSTVGRSPHHHHRHICIPLSRQIWYICTHCYLLISVYVSRCWYSLCPLAGLRKLEAFFGFLITVMALSFGYEVKDCHSFQYISSVCWGTMTCLTVCSLFVVCAGKAKPSGAAKGDVLTLLCWLWTCAAGAGSGNRRRRHHAS